MLHLKANLVATGEVPLGLHCADDARKTLDAFDQRILIFPLQACKSYAMFLGGKTYCEANADIVLERRLRLVVVSGYLKL